MMEMLGCSPTYFLWDWVLLISLIHLNFTSWSLFAFYTFDPRAFDSQHSSFL